MSKSAPIPMLFFVPTLELAYELQAQLGEAKTSVLSSDTGPLELRRVITDQATGERPYVVATAAGATGWRAPLGTIVGFHPDFPQELREQALARVPGVGRPVPRG